MTVLEETITTVKHGVMMKRMVILVDTAEDVPAVRENWDAGSMCVIAADHSYKILNEQGEWV